LRLPAFGGDPGERNQRGDGDGGEELFHGRAPV
jgi:hypothetical protein